METARRRKLNALLVALDDLGVDERHGDAYVVGLAVEHVGREITLSFDTHMSDNPWTTHCYVEQPLESEPKLVQASGPTPGDAIDACVRAAEEEERRG